MTFPWQDDNHWLRQLVAESDVTAPDGRRQRAVEALRHAAANPTDPALVRQIVAWPAERSPAEEDRLLRVFEDHLGDGDNLERWTT